VRNLLQTERLFKTIFFKKTIFLLFCFILLSSLSLHPQNAPVTTAGRVINATPGNPSVPIAVTVTGFSNIGQFTLTMKFDTTRVRYISASTNPSLPGMTVTYTSPSGNTQGTLVFAWTGASNISLADGSSLVGLTFHYVTGTGILTWAYTFGSVCQYKRYVSGILTTLNDSPQNLYYLNGGISNRSGPVTFAPTFTNPVPGSLPVPITVNGFTDIGAITLYLEYDPAVITYQNSFTKNSAFGSSFLVGDNPGTGGKRLIVIQWYGNSVTIPNGSILCTLNFNYPSANCNPCALSWFETGPSCEYADGPGDVLIDMPQATYYINGLVAEGLLYTWTGTVSSAWDNVSNWNACGIPDISRKVVIPNVSPHSFPIITGTASCKSIKIQTGATLSVGPTGSSSQQPVPRSLRRGISSQQP
jgi:hypothetical protein